MVALAERAMRGDAEIDRGRCSPLSAQSGLPTESNERHKLGKFDRHLTHSFIV